MSYVFSRSTTPYSTERTPEQAQDDVDRSNDMLFWDIEQTKRCVQSTNSEEDAGRAKGSGGKG